MNNDLRRQWPILSVYAGLVVSVLAIIWIDFQVGAVMLALSVLWAFVLRYRLTDAKAGWLRIRRRRVDLTMLAALGVALLILALVVPAHRG